MKRQQLLLLILAFGVFSILNTEMGIIGILPMAAAMYHVDIVQAGMLVSMFALGVAIAGPTMPLLFSRFNRKRVMLLVLGVFTLCNALAVVASDFQILLVLRVVPAFFHPVYCALAFSVAVASVAPEDAPRAVARINMGVAAGMVVGVPISNVLAATFDFSVAMAFFAGVTGLMFLLTMAFVPDLPVTQPMRYGAQLSVLKRPPVWLAIVAVICLNGSIFGVYNYLADYLQKIAALPGDLIAALLLVYGLLNVCGSYLGGNLLARCPSTTVRLFPLCTIALYCLLFAGGGKMLPLLVALIVAWGILGGINANINQYLLACVASDAPDFSNGLFLTAAFSYTASDCPSSSAVACCWRPLPCYSQSSYTAGQMSNKRRIVLSARNKWLYGRLLFIFDASAMCFRSYWRKTLLDFESRRYFFRVHLPSD